MSDKTPTVEILERRLERERNAREQAERLLEAKSLELWRTNQALEARVRSRTAALRRAKDMAEAAALAHGDFLANMSHEIRTPMNGIIGACSLLQQRPLSTENAALVAVIAESGRSLLTLLNNILDLSKLEEGQVPMDPEPVDLGCLISGVLELVGHANPEKPVAMNLTYPPEVPRWFCTDGGKIRQVVLNLVSNAFKFTYEGRIDVVVSTEAVEDTEWNVRIEVRDTGIGIDPENASALFDKFTQAERSTSRRFGGTGLGLAISRQIVERMGGTIGADGERGKGSTFWFNLTLSESPAPSETERSMVTGRPLADLRALVVEDNLVNQAILARMLERLGAYVSCADDGLEAVELCRTADFDVILMDCQMPRLDGYEATRQLRGRKYEVPIIALTANTHTRDIERCRSAGMNGHLTKPVILDQLVKTMLSWTTAKAEPGPPTADPVPPVDPDPPRDYSR